MLETLKQIAECLTDYIRLIKALFPAFIAVITFFKKSKLSDKRYTMSDMPKAIELRMRAAAGS
ncbi:MAG TPA: hypothetical protein VNV43_02670 [Candidatus Acidoferrales bacterium]|jgi:hypothetical protein|nr:hypothetical protein [Candidatus Acidoferrales bacterium]